MSNDIELRDLDEARTFVLQSLWLQRVTLPTEKTVEPALSWAMEIINGGQPLPGLGFLADLGQFAFATDSIFSNRQEFPVISGLPQGLMRTYEDYVLGKLFGDQAFERAGDALRHYKGRDRARGLAFVVNQFRERADFVGIYFSPALLKTLLKEKPDQLLKEGRASLDEDGPMDVMVEAYESLVAAARNVGEILGPEDVREIELGTALDEYGQRVALRQVLSAETLLESKIPDFKPNPLVRRHTVATQMLEEDSYPVGGFSSLSNKGTMESLLHSQLSFMEEDDERPDLFDIKFVRDELLYYSRDENQFFRQRRTNVIALHPDLVTARFKDADLPYQRIILVLAMIVVTVHKLTKWLAEDALVFEIHFLEPKKKGDSLEQERKLLETILREQITNETVVLRTVKTPQQIKAECEKAANRSRCHCLFVSYGGHAIKANNVLTSVLSVGEAVPQLIHEEKDMEWFSEDSLSRWQEAAELLARYWL